MAQLLTPGQVAERYQVSLATVRRWWAAGRLPEPIRPGGTALRWRREDLEAWERSACQSPRATLNVLFPIP